MNGTLQSFNTHHGHNYPSVEQLLLWSVSQNPYLEKIRNPQVVWPPPCFLAWATLQTQLIEPEGDPWKGMVLTEWRGVHDVCHTI